MEFQDKRTGRAGRTTWKYAPLFVLLVACSGRSVGSSQCILECLGRECGPDGCGGVCGTCPPGDACNADGRCVDGCGDTRGLQPGSPWPMFRRCPTRIGRSPYVASEVTRVMWSFRPDGQALGSPVISADGTVYVGAVNWEIRYAGGLYALDAYGTVKWFFPTEGGARSPAIGSDGTVYFGSADGYVYAVNPNGTLKWAVDTGLSVASSPAIGGDGTIYIGSGINLGRPGGRFFAINPDGTVRWVFEDEAPVYSSPAVSADGIIYFAVSTCGLENNDSYCGLKDKLLAFRPDGAPVSSVEIPAKTGSCPVVGPDGTVYVFSEWNLYAVGPDGTVKWRVPGWEPLIFGYSTTPAIGADGTVYVALGFSHLLEAYRPDGSQKWSAQVGGSSPVIDGQGTVLLGSGGQDTVYALDPDGNPKWSFQMELDVGPFSTVMDGDGTLYVSHARFGENRRDLEDSGIYALGP